MTSDRTQEYLAGLVRDGYLIAARGRRCSSADKAIKISQL